MTEVPGGLANKRVLITGASGMVGANLAHRLVALGIRPSVLMRPTSRTLRLDGIRDCALVVGGDLREAVSVCEAVREAAPDIVFHIASSFFNPPTLTAQEHFDSNVTGTLNLLEALKDRPGVRFVFTGSAAAYAGGKLMTEDTSLAPTTVFGASKAAGTIVGQTYARLYGLEFVELRLFQTYGPWDRASRLVPYVILRALSGKPVEIGNGTQQRDFVYVGDIVEALLEAAVRPLPPGLVLNIASGTGCPISTVAETILDAMGNPVPLRIGARATRPDEIWTISGDASAAERHLGWRPRTSLEDGLKKSIAWFTENRATAQQL